jgi:hypothetical protein
VAAQRQRLGVITLSPSTIAAIFTDLAGPGLSDMFTATQAGDYTFTVSPSGPFSALTFQLETWSAYRGFVVATWDALANPSASFALKDGGTTYRLNCTGFVGGTSVSVQVGGANHPLPADPYFDLQEVASVENPATGQVRLYASNAPSLNAIDSNGNSVIMAGSLAPGSSVDGGIWP